MTAHDSIGHVEKCLFGNFCSDVHGGSVGRASVFQAKVVGLNLDLVTFFSSFYHNFFLLSDNSSFKANKYIYVCDNGI